MEEQIQKSTEKQLRPTTVYEKSLAILIIGLGCVFLLAALAALVGACLGKLPFGRGVYGLFLGGGTLGLGGYAWKNPAYWDRPFGKFLKVLIPLLILLFIFVIFVNR
jgi:lipoprotein